MNRLTKRLIKEVVEPTAAKASLPVYRPTTMMSAALNSSCKMPEHISGSANSRILLNSGPLHISISYVLFMEAFPLPSAKLAGRNIKSFPLPFSPFSSLGGSPHDHYSDLLSKDKIEFSTSFFLYAFLFCKREKARFFALCLRLLQLRLMR